MTSRRQFLQQSAASAVGIALPAIALAESYPASVTQDHASPPRSFLDLKRAPDSVTVEAATGSQRLTAARGGRWNGTAGLSVTTLVTPNALRVDLSSPTTAVKRLHLRWRGKLDTTRLLLGDAWERGYGDLEWRGFAPDRAMPWYVAAWDGASTHAYGVRTGAKSFCFWQMDAGGISLFADVRSGAAGVQLGERVLTACEVVCRPGQPNESPFAAVHAFCKQMCAAPKLPSQPVYGSNDWYYAYGNNSEATVLGDAERIVELSPPSGNRPFAVIDDGWQPGRGKDKVGAGTWDKGNDKFPDVPGLVAKVKQIGARPGVWIRPLEASADTPASWRLSRERNVLDPTVPEVRQKITEDFSRLRQWGFDLIKHDYSTYDLFGRWGFQMGTSLTKDGWTFSIGPTRTTAEVIDELYGTIRAASGGALIIGCNTVSHLSAGHFEICRIGDDTSGTEWGRVRKMGVNTLAFRGAQHGAFYTADADCVGVTNAIPWELNRQWLDLLARSGTMLFVSLSPDALDAERRKDLKSAMALASRPQPLGEPLDWQKTVYPTRWRSTNGERSYDWVGAEGAVPPE
ncbi:MAG: glycoside hydrolase family 36 protein [bacterium]